ncbi:hypothetical protein [Spirulina sp. 06S082]|uniref:hypothetical protein n=1 Tax=Spirulina sp. 06S082 TaxID=3110248 RepID=UPI002B1F41EB|nr:hypothetical protein [Spirulina sp. 06S082]MEA5471685.1 hypothetical protein [Spirulina sp. 06S082]
MPNNLTLLSCGASCTAFLLLSQMKPISYYCDNATTQLFADTWGDYLEELPTNAKEFFIYSISTLLFAKISVDVLRALFQCDEKPFISRSISYFDKEIESFRNCSQYELAKILGFFRDSLLDEYRELENNG